MNISAKLKSNLQGGESFNCLIFIIEFISYIIQVIYAYSKGRLTYDKEQLAVFTTQIVYTYSLAEAKDIPSPLYLLCKLYMLTAAKLKLFVR